MTYKIVSGSSLENIEKKINELLSTGWELYGFLLVTARNDYGAYVYYSQAMTKKG